MRRFGAATLLAMVALACASASPLRRPDFTGSWTIDKSATRLELLNIANLDRATLDIVQTADMLKFQRTFIISGRENTYAYELPLDGTVTTTTAADQVLHSRLYWDGDALVFFTRIAAPAGETTNVVHYRLSADGNTLRAAERRRGIQNYDNLWVFRRER